MASKLDLPLKIVATAIAIFGVWKYFEDRAESDRNRARNESLKIVREFSSSHNILARQALVKFWTSQKKFSVFISSSDSITSNEYKNFVRRVFPNSAEYEIVQNALFRINDYFDSAYYCRVSGVCDAELIDSFLCSKAASLSRIYSPFFQILNRSISSSEFGQSLHRYADRCESDQ